MKKNLEIQDETTPLIEELSANLKGFLEQFDLEKKDLLKPGIKIDQLPYLDLSFQVSPISYLTRIVMREHFFFKRLLWLTTKEKIIAPGFNLSDEKATYDKTRIYPQLSTFPFASEYYLKNAYGTRGFTAGAELLVNKI